MSELVWLIGIPLTLIGITVWQPSLVTAVPAFLGIYITFVVGLFSAPFASVAIVWLCFAVAVLPFLFYKFPGQYNFARSLSTLYMWPILAVISGIVERQITIVVPADEVPPRFEATVNYIQSAGPEGEYLMVFFEEFHETAFFCSAELETDHGLCEDERFVCHVKQKSVENITGDVLWIKSIEQGKRSSGGRPPGMD